MQENLASMETKKDNQAQIITNSITGKKYKRILSKISKGSLNLCDDIVWKKEDSKLNGWIYFSVKLEDIGLDIYDFKQKNPQNNIGRELFSNYMIDFIGELLLRSNIDKFLQSVFALDENEYLYLVSLEKHKRFGAQLDIENSKITLCFHASILQTILTEDFKYYMVS